MGKFKRVVIAEQMLVIIEQVHKNEVCRSGIFKTYKKVSFAFCDFWNLKISEIEQKTKYEVYRNIIALSRLYYQMKIWIVSTENHERYD